MNEPNAVLDIEINCVNYRIKAQHLIGRHGDISLPRLTGKLGHHKFSLWIYEKSLPMNPQGHYHAAVSITNPPLQWHS